MSSMLKKTGGLSFKPKAARRPGPGPSKPTAGSAAPTTTTEPSSQSSTPATADSSTPAVVVDSIAEAGEQDEPQVSSAQLPKPKPSPKPPKTSTPRKPTTVASRPDKPAAQSTSEPAIASPPPPSQVLQNPTPPPSNETVQSHPPRSEPSAPSVDSSKHGTLKAPRVEPEDESLAASGKPLEIPSTQPATTSDAASPGEETTSGPSTEAPSPSPVSTSAPASESNSATPQSSEDVTPQEKAPAKAPKKAAGRRRKLPELSDRVNTDDSAPKKKRQRKTPASRTTVEPSEDASTESQPTSTKRRTRNPTPENAEELTVDHTTMTVGELTKDLGIGKRFKHAEEIEQRARDARARNRQRRLDRAKQKAGLLPYEDEEEAPENSGENPGTQGAAMAQLGASMEAGAGQGVGYDVVDGQIVVHAASLVVDRHNRDLSNLEEVEENDFTNLVTSSSFAKRVQAPGNWTEEDTEKFYRLLGMFGTDFETISRLFPGKNRRAIKLKFNKEERLHPNRVNAAMMVRGQKKVGIDIEEYKAAQRQWQAKDKILAEQAKLSEEHEREVSRLREERRAAGLIDDNEKPKKNNANAAGRTLGPDEFEVIEEDADALPQG